LAILKITWKLSKDFNENFDSSNDVLNISFSEIGDGFVDFFINIFGISKASLDQWKIIFLNKTVDDSGDELFGLVDIDSVLGEP
jgi:hypothetical protein